MRKFNAIKNAVNFGKGKNTMNKFNEQKQIEETTEFQDSEVMNELNNEQQFTSMAQKRRFEMLKNELQTDEEFRLTAPEGENSDDDSIGELSTNDEMFIDDSRDLIELEK